MNFIFKKTYSVLSSFLSKKNVFLINSLPYLKRNRRIPLNRFDFVRYSTLELCAEEIYAGNVMGSVAELGVYKGEFAKELNLVFPDRSLYLFDTFEGFSKNDIDTEIQNNFSSGKQDFSDTSVEIVLSKMKFRDKCIVKKGFFPGSAEGVNDTFCFVSIDADLYDPIYSGLNYFFPRLQPGGFIFVHDFNNEEYKGAREAVLKFCSESKSTYVPITDVGGTAVIRKSKNI
ncbi:MAG: TylF/MycF/NovP-related O-methyltransferase [Bacteroidota bacterium]